jgi:hypothetical protein
MAANEREYRKVCQMTWHADTESTEDGMTSAAARVKDRVLRDAATLWAQRPRPKSMTWIVFRMIEASKVNEKCRM